MAITCCIYNIQRYTATCCLNNIYWQHCQEALLEGEGEGKPGGGGSGKTGGGIEGGIGGREEIGPKEEGQELLELQQQEEEEE